MRHSGGGWHWRPATSGDYDPCSRSAARGRGDNRNARLLGRVPKGGIAAVSFPAPAITVEVRKWHEAAVSRAWPLPQSKEERPFRRQIELSVDGLNELGLVGSIMRERQLIRLLAIDWVSRAIGLPRRDSSRVCCGVRQSR